ncbi:uncharacterized protein [Dysidea avara]|uniref:uncharacterized protein n=1 Tax=Dysidea avara TaxID=196820 RepID=UPI00332A171A
MSIPDSSRHYGTTYHNRYVIVFQDLFMKWPMVFPTPDQKAVHIAQLLVMMKDICRMLGIEKLNTTASHPQCNGAIEIFNRTIKMIIRKHAAKFGLQRDQYLSRVLWAYHNTPHSSTGEKPSFLLYGFDCRTSTEAALLPTKPLKATKVSDYVNK